jgi:hypothetical protein
VPLADPPVVGLEILRRRLLAIQRERLVPDRRRILLDGVAVPDPGIVIRWPG